MRRLLVIACLAIASATIFPSHAYSQIRGFRQRPVEEWEFSKDGSSWEKIAVPHSYNAEDGQSDSFYRGAGTYRTTIRIENVAVDNYLYFEGVAQACKVKVNGKTLANHKGGYTPFPVKLTEAQVKGDNKVEVVCTNVDDTDMAPVSSDFNRNGGMHAAVWLLGMEDLYFSPEDYGQYRVMVETPEVSPRKVSTNVKATIVNGSRKETKVLVRVQLLESDGRLAYQADREFFVRAYSEYEFSHDFYLTGLRLWDGVKDPYLYTVRIEMFAGKRMLDIAETKIGYRSFEIDAQQGFLLNGKPYPLRGVAMQQDMEGKASAMSESDFRRDFGIVKELGANFLRLAHYPHNDIAYRLCDSLGIIVQAEIPWTHVCGRNASQLYFNNLRHQTSEMVVNLYNHPSIAFWGMWSGLDKDVNSDDLQGELDAPRVVAESDKLCDHIKSLDPVRFVGFSDISCLGRAGYQNIKSDFCAQAVHGGWQSAPGDYRNFPSIMKTVRSRWSGPICLSGYGVGIDPGCHTWNEAQMCAEFDESRHFEEYGNLFHEAYVRHLKSMPWLVYACVWSLFDFPLSGYPGACGESSGGAGNVANCGFLDDKGLVTRDRNLKKDVFYLYKSLWNRDETTVHITGSRQTSFPGDKYLTIKVYSNARSLTLYQNGSPVKTLRSSGESTGVVWSFSGIRLKTRRDTFKVVSDNSVSDAISLERI